MKLFKKLMATALAGVMALSMMTGCAAKVNDNEIVAYLNDSKAFEYASVKVHDEVYGHDYWDHVETGIKTAEQGDSTTAREVLKKVKTYAENHTYDGAYGRRSIEEAAEQALDSVHGDDYAKIAKIAADSKDAYYLAFTKVNEFKSNELKNQQDSIIAQSLTDFVQLNSIGDRTTLGDKAVASIATEKIGEDTFVVVVLVQAAK